MIILGKLKPRMCENGVGRDRQEKGVGFLDNIAL